MKVVLSEKPSVARDIAAFLGADKRHDGYYQGRGYQVTWAFGHLVTLKMPEDYDPALKKWSLQTLPFVPSRFELKLIDDSRSLQQFSVIARLLKGASEIIAATDAGREGELIFRYILQMTGGGGKSFKRLWLRSLTPAAIGDAFNKLRPGRDYDALYAAARCRSESDWIVGINATRNLTVRYGSGGVLWSVGRVQTPVLAMIARRDDEIRHFKPEPFWELRTRYRGVTFRYRGDRFGQRAAAQQLLAKVQRHPFVIRQVESKRERMQPPLLYDLTTLQREMNRRHGMSAEQTLKTAQALYEDKAITYPRTDSRHLSTDIKSEIPDILRKLSRIREADIRPLDLGALPFTSRIIQNQKVTDHHAIIPTGKLPGSLSPASRHVFDAIVTRLIAVFYPACIKAVTTVDGVSNATPFRARGVRILEAGWTALYPAPPKNKETEEQETELPAFSSGEQGPHEPFVHEGKTQPPRHFTENTLLGAMETAGKMVTDESLKAALKDKGLGTPATRAAIIETLLKRGYISREKKTLQATDLGRYLVALVQDAHLKSPELTGAWESKLRAIENGELAPNQFMADIIQFTTELIRESDGSVVDASRLGDCPRCGRPVIEGRRGYGCSGWREGCSFVLGKTYKSLDLSVEQVRRLIQRRIVLTPVQLENAGKVILCLSADGRVMDIPTPRPRQWERRGTQVKRPRRSRQQTQQGRGKSTSRETGHPSIGNCPLCNGAVIAEKNMFRCTGRQTACRFAIGKEMAGKRLGSRSIRTLLDKGKTSILKGFRSETGKPFEARLKLEKGKVRLEMR